MPELTFQVTSAYGWTMYCSPYQLLDAPASFEDFLTFVSVEQWRGRSADRVAPAHASPRVDEI